MQSCLQKPGKEAEEKPWCIRDETRQPLQSKMGSGSLPALPFSCNWGCVRHCLSSTVVPRLRHAEQQAICWLLFWQNCQGLSSIKWWMELRGSKESRCVCSGCAFLRLRGKRHRTPGKRFVNSESSLAHIFGCVQSDHKTVCLGRK